MQSCSEQRPLLPDWFVRQEQVKIWHDDNNYWDDDEIVEWYNEDKTHS